MTDHEYTNEEKIILFMIYTSEQLIDTGIIEGPKYLTAAGKVTVEKWIEEGYRPTDEEMHWALSEILDWQREGESNGN